MKTLETKESNTTRQFSTSEELTSEQERAKNYELFKRDQIEGTPFMVISDVERNVCFGVLGNARLTLDRPLEEVEDLKKDMKEITWYRLIQVIMVIFDKENEIKKEIEEFKEQLKNKEDE